MILAAGLGTRLRPLTDDRPKALVTVEGHTLLELAICRLAAAGVGHVVVNVHHFADMMEDYIASHSWPCRISVSDERVQLLDTGGALRHAAPLFDGRNDVLVHNVDVLSDIDLHALATQHRREGNLATLCVSRRTTKRLLAFDAAGCLVGRWDSQGIAGCEALAFSGISIVNPHLFDLLPDDRHPYPIIDEYINLVAHGERIAAFLHSPDHWMDVGKPDTLKLAEQWIASYAQ